MIAEHNCGTTLLIALFTDGSTTFLTPANIREQIMHLYSRTRTHQTNFTQAYKPQPSNDRREPTLNVLST